jgi:hypothetical protein
LVGIERYVLIGIIFTLFVVGCEKETTINFEVSPTKTMPSYVGFEKSGLWVISVYLDEKHLEEFLLNIK